MSLGFVAYTDKQGEKFENIKHSFQLFIHGINMGDGTHYTDTFSDENVLGFARNSCMGGLHGIPEKEFRGDGFNLLISNPSFTPRENLQYSCINCKLNYRLDSSVNHLRITHKNKSEVTLSIALSRIVNDHDTFRQIDFHSSVNPFRIAWLAYCVDGLDTSDNSILSSQNHYVSGLHYLAHLDGFVFNSEISEILSRYEPKAGRHQMGTDQSDILNFLAEELGWDPSEYKHSYSDRKGFFEFNIYKRKLCSINPKMKYYIDTSLVLESSKNKVNTLSNEIIKPYEKAEKENTLSWNL